MDTLQQILCGISKLTEGQERIDKQLEHGRKQFTDISETITLHSTQLACAIQKCAAQECVITSINKRVKNNETEITKVKTAKRIVAWLIGIAIASGGLVIAICKIAS